MVGNTTNKRGGGCCEYQIRHACPHPHVRKEASLAVQLLSQSTPEPEFAAPIIKHVVTAGKDAALKCVVENLGDYKVTWKTVDTQKLLSVDSHVMIRNERISVSNPDKNTWFLHIRNVVPEDTGYYTCQINTQPMKSQVGYLDVVVPPEFVTNMTNRNVTVTENSNVTLSCKATGNPKPTITWRREDGQPFILNGERVHQYTSDELSIIGVKRTHMAAYICLASNNVPPPIRRRIYLDVKFPPLIWIQNQVVGAPESTDVTLECHTQAHPPSENFWKKDSKPVATDDRYIAYLSRTSYKAHMRLTIKKLRNEDYGNYKCVAKNNIIETEGSIMLYNLKIPVVETQKTSTEEILTRPPKRTTVPVTTEKYVVTIEVERTENLNDLPGKQQKYGDGAVKSKVKNSAQTIWPLRWVSLAFCVRTALLFSYR